MPLPGTLRVIFDDPTKQAVLDLYPPRPELDALIEADIASYSAASALAGSVVTDPEPDSATFLAFDAPVELTRAAAELWVTSEEFQLNLGKLPADLAPRRGPRHAPRILRQFRRGGLPTRCRSLPLTAPYGEQRGAWTRRGGIDRPPAKEAGEGLPTECGFRRGAPADRR